MNSLHLSWIYESEFVFMTYEFNTENKDNSIFWIHIIEFNSEIYNMILLLWIPKLDSICVHGPESISELLVAYMWHSEAAKCNLPKHL